MSKVILVATLAVFGFNNSTFSQSKTEIEIGVVGTTMHPGKENGNGFVKTAATYKVAYQVKATINFKINNRTNVYFGLLFIQRSTAFSQIKNSDRDNRDILMNYLGVPAGMSFLLFKKGGLSTSLLFGVYFNYCIYGREKGTYYDAGTNSTSAIYNTVEVKNSNQYQTLPTVVRPLDYGMQTAIKTNYNRFSVAIDYILGFAGVFTNPSLYDRQYYHRSVGFSLGYSLFPQNPSQRKPSNAKVY